MRIAFLMGLGTVIFFSSQGSLRGEEKEKIITAINADGFLGALNRKNQRTDMDEFGVGMSLLENENYAGNLGIAVHPSIEHAKKAFAFRLKLCPTHPDFEPVRIGEETRTWTSLPMDPKELEGGPRLPHTIEFRRRNVVVDFSIGNLKKDPAPFCRQIDGFLTTPNSFVTEGHFTTLPRIVGLPRSLELAEGEVFEMRPMIAGVPPDGIKRGGFWGSGLLNLSPDGWIRLKPTVENKPRTHIVKIFLASKDLVFLSGKITIHTFPKEEAK